MILEAFIPNNLEVPSLKMDSKGNYPMLKVRLCIIHSNNAVRYYIEKYYHSNFARNEMIGIDKLQLIDGYRNRTSKVNDLYNRVFNN